ncbi:hypothetical protein AABB24_012536, partial [Solanum stoloniferum]
ITFFSITFTLPPLFLFPKNQHPKLLSHGPITAPRDPPPPSSETTLGCRKNVNSGSSLPHLSLALFNQSVKVRFCKIFLLVQNFFTTSSKIGVSKNSKFEFLEPKSTIKGGLPSSFTGASEKWERRSRNIQKQSRNKEKNNLRSGKEFEVGILDVEALVCCSTEGAHLEL